VPPEQLLLASPLQAFYGIRSERLLLEQLSYNLLYCWFVGRSPDEPISHPTISTKIRERRLNEQVYMKRSKVGLRPLGRFLEKLMQAPEVKPLLSYEHFSVDAPLLQALASHASMERTDGQQDPPLPPSDPSEGLGLSRRARSGRLPRPEAARGGATRVISVVSSSATRPSAQRLTQMHYWPACHTPIQLNRAIGAMCSWITAMP
jgi:hypothetical protein